VQASCNPKVVSPWSTADDRHCSAQALARASLPDGVSAQVSQLPDAVSAQVSQPQDGVSAQASQLPDGVSAQASQLPDGVSAQVSQPQGAAGAVEASQPPLGAAGVAVEQRQQVQV